MIQSRKVRSAENISRCWFCTHSPVQCSKNNRKPETFARKSNPLARKKTQTIVKFGNGVKKCIYIYVYIIYIYIYLSLSLPVSLSLPFFVNPNKHKHVLKWFMGKLLNQDHVSIGCTSTWPPAKLRECHGHGTSEWMPWRRCQNWRGRRALKIDELKRACQLNRAGREPSSCQSRWHEMTWTSTATQAAQFTTCFQSKCHLVKSPREAKAANAHVSSMKRHTK